MKSEEIIEKIKEATDKWQDRSEEENLLVWESLFGLICDKSDVGEIRAAWKYSEPGYVIKNERLPILFADLNHPVMVAFCDFTDWLGGVCDIHFSEGWETCDDCGGAVRYLPDSYGWKQYSLRHSDGSVTCGDCLAEDPQRYFSEIAGKPQQAITIDSLRPEEHGYVLVNAEPFEYGIQGGQKSSPYAIFNCLQTVDLATTSVFKINAAEQFSVKFSVYVLAGDEETARDALRTGNTNVKVGPKLAIERGLKAAIKAVQAGATEVNIDLDDPQYHN